MKFMVESKIVYTLFNTYREAEIFCGENGIHPENIYETTDEEAEEIFG